MTTSGQDESYQPSIREKLEQIIHPDHSGRIIGNLALDLIRQAESLPNSVHHVSNQREPSRAASRYVQRQVENFDDHVAGKLAAGFQMPFAQDDREKVIQRAARVSKQLGGGQGQVITGPYNVETQHPDRIPVLNYAEALRKFAQNPSETSFTLAEKLDTHGQGEQVTRFGDGGTHARLVNLLRGKDGLSGAIIKTLAEVGVDASSLFSPDSLEIVDTKFKKMKVKVTRDPQSGQDNQLVGLSLVRTK